ncbi:lipocalin-like domain-containing protein [Vibrio gallicus]|uniref:lipocalin-like domain-containing protein n=1 Tax=Vibrio gallicus TaxID=190897 RepID=UPI0021C3CCFD|nr:lipocalin-like domain-containing protein [Vibrio gallicus]
MTRRILNRTLWTLACLIILIVVISSSLYIYDFSKSDTNLTIENIKAKQTHVFEPVLPNKAVQFPNDFKIHSEYRFEIWSFVAMLNDTKGNEYLAQWYLYRRATSENKKSGWESPQIYASQVALTTPDNIYSAERFARGGIGLVGMRSRPYRLSIDNWVWRSFSSYPVPGRLLLKTDDFKLDLKLQQNGSYIPMGDRGYQVTNKLQSQAIYGYQAPYIGASGTVNIGERKYALSGNVWLNQIWGSTEPKPEQSHIRFLYRLNNGKVLFLTQVISPSGLPHIYGSIMDHTGQVHTLDNSNVELTSSGTSTLSNGKVLPLQWTINIPKFKIFLTSDATRREQWLDLSIPSWSGTVRASGSENARGFMQVIE